MLQMSIQQYAPASLEKGILKNDSENVFGKGKC